ncbi:Protein CBG28029 [Caenorhabditis briggsae]|uniref:Protein CBG28029 n=2 Tax=Caenorhabditis briggsae TaxID=6238 RepID=B6IG25_CAEBR|nr:Protein CBG28029 [Caenorhabditis briggsae]ULT84260.1 hypothetical protein L3Y34_013132 [Caenorhabditis briggsae]CAR98855.1 Protein CBG28029 [Caenorhabditis briggsae]
MAFRLGEIRADIFQIYRKACKEPTSISSTPNVTIYSDLHRHVLHKGIMEKLTVWNRIEEAVTKRDQAMKMGLPYDESSHSSDEKQAFSELGHTESKRSCRMNARAGQEMKPQVHSKKSKTSRKPKAQVKKAEIDLLNEENDSPVLHSMVPEKRMKCDTEQTSSPHSPEQIVKSPDSACTLKIED